MPQWDFLNFLSEQGKRYPGFDLCLETEATDLIVEGDRVVGLRALSQGRPVEFRADLVVGADGRHSTVRERAGLAGRKPRCADGCPMDAPCRASRATPGRPAARSITVTMMVTINRGDYWQCAYLIRKGGYDCEIR